MQSLRVVVCFVVLFLVSCFSLASDSLVVKSKMLTVLGTLADESASGTEGTGWAIYLNPVIMFDGKQISSLQLKSTEFVRVDKHRLASLEDKFVQARGRLTYVSGTETVQRPVFAVLSIREHKDKEPKP